MKDLCLCVHASGCIQLNVGDVGWRGRLIHYHRWFIPRLLQTKSDGMLNANGKERRSVNAMLPGRSTQSHGVKARQSKHTFMWSSMQLPDWPGCSGWRGVAWHTRTAMTSIIWPHPSYTHSNQLIGSEASVGGHNLHCLFFKCYFMQNNQSSFRNNREG